MEISAAMINAIAMKEFLMKNVKENIQKTKRKIVMSQFHDITHGHLTVLPPD